MHCHPACCFPVWQNGIQRFGKLLPKFFQKTSSFFSLAGIFFSRGRAIMNPQGGIGMKDRQTLQVSIHYSMAFVGGFFGAYALLNHCDIFGSSQTANLITLVTGLLGHNSHEILIRIGAALLYGLAIALSVVIPRTLGWNLKFLSIFLNGAAALTLFYIPATIFWPCTPFFSPPPSSGAPLKECMDTPARRFFPPTTTSRRFWDSRNICVIKMRKRFGKESFSEGRWCFSIWA